MSTQVNANVSPWEPRSDEAAPGPALVCPTTKQRLFYRAGGAGSGFRDAQGRPRADASAPALVREDGERMFAVVGGVPQLMAPLAFTAPGAPAPQSDLPQYAEALEEMAIYNGVAAARAHELTSSQPWRDAIAPVLGLSPAARQNFPEPSDIWCDALYEFAAQREAYQKLAPVTGKRLLQMGGTGTHALKFLLAGAAEAWLLTPMAEEARLTRQIALELGLEERFHAVVGVGEELPFANACFDGIFCGGCLHHMLLDHAVAEARRVLAPGGVFVAIEPWRTPLHPIGRALLGGRDHGVHCRPINPARVRQFQYQFPDGQCRRFGALLRYPLLVLQKCGLNFEDDHVRSALDFDERLCRRCPPLRRLGSAVLLYARRAPAAPVDAPRAYAESAAR